MSFSNIYPNLPGMLVNFKDGGMSLRQDVITEKTDSLLILGTAQDGPVLEPVAVDDASVEAVFGKSINENGTSNGSTLVRAYRQARKRGCSDIRLMRVTGSPAKLNLAGEEITYSGIKRVEEKIGIISGNASTVLTLSRQNIIKGFTKVFVKGSELLTGFEVDTVNGTVTIQSGVTEAGAQVTVQYSFVEERTKTEAVYVVEQSKVTLKETPVGDVVVLYNDEIVDGSNYALTQKTITFSPEASIPELSEIKITYNYLSPRIDVTENGTEIKPFVTETDNMVFELSYIPKTDSARLYIDGALIQSTKNFVIDYEEKTITLNKKDFSKGSSVSVEYVYEITESVSSQLSIESFFGGSVYNQGAVEVKPLVNELGEIIGKQVVLTKPNSKKGSSLESDLIYTSLDYPTLGLLAEAITNDSKNGVYKAKTNSEDILTKDLIVTGKTYFVNGFDGTNINKQELYEALCGKRNEDGYLEKQGAFQLLEDYATDWIVPVGVYADDELDLRDQNFAYELALLCAVLSYRNKTTLGAIAMKPNRDTSLSGIQEYAKKVASFKNAFLMKDGNGAIIKDADGNPIDLGKFLSVIVGPEIQEVDSTLGMFLCNPAVDYAAMNTPLLPQSSPTNKVVANAKKLNFNFSNAQLDKITENRIITFKERAERNGRKSIIVVDGVTAALPVSDYTRITTPKVLKFTVDSLREVSEPFLGEPSTIEQRNALSAQISKRLTILKEKGVIVDSTFQIITTAQDQLLGSAQIELSIIPPQELRRITAIVGLKPSI